MDACATNLLYDRLYNRVDTLNLTTCGRQHWPVLSQVYLVATESVALRRAASGMTSSMLCFLEKQLDLTSLTSRAYSFRKTFVYALDVGK